MRGLLRESNDHFFPVWIWSATPWRCKGLCSAMKPFLLSPQILWFTLDGRTQPPCSNIVLVCPSPSREVIVSFFFIIIFIYSSLILKWSLSYVKVLSLASILYCVYLTIPSHPPCRNGLASVPLTLFWRLSRILPICVVINFSVWKRKYIHPLTHPPDPSRETPALFLTTNLAVMETIVIW